MALSPPAARAGVLAGVVVVLHRLHGPGAKPGSSSLPSTQPRKPVDYPLAPVGDQSDRRYLPGLKSKTERLSISMIDLGRSKIPFGGGGGDTGGTPSMAAPPIGCRRMVAFQCLLGRGMESGLLFELLVEGLVSGHAHHQQPGCSANWSVAAVCRAGPRQVPSTRQDPHVTCLYISTTVLPEPVAQQRPAIYVPINWRTQMNPQ